MTINFVVILCSFLFFLSSSSDIPIDIDLMTTKSDFAFARYFTAIITNKYECGSTFDFLDNKDSKRREAFKEGKFCFLDIIEKEDGEERKQYYEQNYDALVDLITIRPNSTICQGAFIKINTIQCKVKRNFFKVNNEALKIKNATEYDLGHVFTDCENAKECVQSLCSFPSTEKEEIRKECEKLASTIRHLYHN